jgi:hypothetical protein
MAWLGMRNGEIRGWFTRRAKCEVVFAILLWAPWAGHGAEIRAGKIQELMTSADIEATFADSNLELRCCLNAMSRSG